ncbi:MAG: tetratricopeptide repeat protein [Paludibacteraceae bacterium]|nr:tetratricopeptide repeat protein [Paludibacteraceae bacterium]
MKHNYSYFAFVLSLLVLGALSFVHAEQPVNWALTNLPTSVYNVHDFHNGLAVFRDSSTYQYGAIDRNGNIVYPPIYAYLGDFYGNNAILKTKDSIGIIDIDGKWIYGPNKYATINECFKSQKHWIWKGSYDTGFNVKEIIPDLFRVSEQKEYIYIYQGKVILRSPDTAKIVYPLLISKRKQIAYDLHRYELFSFKTYSVHDALGIAVFKVINDKIDIAYQYDLNTYECEAVSSISSKGLKLCGIYSNGEAKYYEFRDTTTGKPIKMSIKNKFDGSGIGGAYFWEEFDNYWRYNKLVVWKGKGENRVFYIIDADGKVIYKSKSYPGYYTYVSLRENYFIVKNTKSNGQFLVCDYAGNRILDDKGKKRESFYHITGDWWYKKDVIYNFNTNKQYDLQYEGNEANYIVGSCMTDNKTIYKLLNILIDSITTITPPQNQGIDYVRIKDSLLYFYDRDYSWFYLKCVMDKANKLLVSSDSIYLRSDNTISEGVIAAKGLTKSGIHGFVYAYPLSETAYVYGQDALDTQRNNRIMAKSKGQYLIHRFHENMKAAQWQFDRKEYSKAAENYRQALKYNPIDVQATTYLGICQYELGQYSTAIQTLRKAIELDANNAIAKTTLQSAIDAKAYAEAKKKRENEQKQACSECETLINAKRHQEALQCCYNLLVQDNQNPYAWNNYGVALSRLGYDDNAIEAFKNALQLKPDFSTATNNIELCKQHKAAVERYNRTQAILEGISGILNTVSNTASQIIEMKSQSYSGSGSSGSSSYSGSSSQRSSSGSSTSGGRNDATYWSRAKNVYSDYESQLIKMNTYPETYSDSQRRYIQDKMRSIRTEWEGKGYKMFKSTWEDWDGRKR